MEPLRYTVLAPGIVERGMVEEKMTRYDELTKESFEIFHSNFIRIRGVRVR